MQHDLGESAPPSAPHSVAPVAVHVAAASAAPSGVPEAPPHPESVAELLKKRLFALGEGISPHARAPEEQRESPNDVTAAVDMLSPAVLSPAALSPAAPPPPPNVTRKQLSCTFELVAGVTSLALTADGSYVVAGATDGTVRLFSMVLGTHDRHGTLLGQIPAKGLHTVLHVHVCVTEDCRIAFAGASRGSALMMAFDLSRLPTWASSRKRRGPLQTFVRSHTHNDAKLKGFCEATRLLPSAAAESGAAAEYRLLCGRGIKNVHVWAFDLADDGHVEWRLLHDLQTNGMTVELAGFRTVGVGVRVYSKSCAQCIRLWDVEGDGKPRFVDVENTADAAVVLDGYAFGGGEQLSLVRIDAEAWANRIELALPGPSAANRRNRRCMRAIKSLVGTQDARDVVVVCSDGSVFHWDRSSSCELKALDGMPHVSEDGDMMVTLSSTPHMPVLLTACWDGRGHSGSGTLHVRPLAPPAPGANRVASFWASSFIPCWPTDDATDADLGMSAAEGGATLIPGPGASLAQSGAPVAHRLWSPEPVTTSAQPAVPAVAGGAAPVRSGVNAKPLAKGGPAKANLMAGTAAPVPRRSSAHASTAPSKSKSSTTRSKPSQPKGASTASRGTSLSLETRADGRRPPKEQPPALEPPEAPRRIISIPAIEVRAAVAFHGRGMRVRVLTSSYDFPVFRPLPLPRQPPECESSVLENAIKINADPTWQPAASSESFDERARLRTRFQDECDRLQGIAKRHKPDESDDEGEGFRDADVIARQRMEAECYVALESLSRWTL